MIDEGRYLAYLVRLWTVHRNGDVVWRASAENAHTGERHAFANPAALYDFLLAAVQETAAASAQRTSNPEDQRVPADLNTTCCDRAVRGGRKHGSQREHLQLRR